MAELVDALISGVSGETRAGSTPVIRTMEKLSESWAFLFFRFNDLPSCEHRIGILSEE